MSSPKREGSENAGSNKGDAEDKPRLSEVEKKANHIASGTPRRLILVCILEQQADKILWIRTETKTSNTRRVRSSYGTCTWSGRTRTQREYSAEEDGRFHACADRGEKAACQSD